MKFVEIREPNLASKKKQKKRKKCTYECVRMQKTWIFAKMMSFAIRLHSIAHFSDFLKNRKHE